jgi:hypothetical protein
MKKLLVKIKVIDIPYSPAIPAEPEKWVKGEEIRLERPMIEVSLGIFEPDEEYTHHEAISGVPEQPEVSHEEIIAQTQGTDEEIAVWLEGDKHKYPEGYWVEYIDISAQVEQERINAESSKYLADTDWLIIREIDAGIGCPLEIKITRQQMRERIVR